MECRPLLQIRRDRSTRTGDCSRKTYREQGQAESCKTQLWPGRPFRTCQGRFQCHKSCIELHSIVSIAPNPKIVTSAASCRAVIQIPKMTVRKLLLSC